MGILHNLSLLLILSAFPLQSRADVAGSVFFLDSTAHRYINPTSSETGGVSVVEVGAAVSLLLGLAPPVTLSASSSFKLNKVLKSNPFDRPRAVFMLDVKEAGDFGSMMPSAKALFASAKGITILDAEKADIQLPDGNEVSLIALNDLSSSNSQAEFGEKELSDFASWLGEPLVANAFEPLNGKLTLSMPIGGRFTLDVSKKADRMFLENLVSLMHAIEKAVDLHQVLSKNMHNPAELMAGSFDGLRVLQEEYGSGGVYLMGLELLSITVSKLFQTLQAAYKGQIVGVVLLNRSPSPESERLLNIMYTSRPSSRWLEETKGSSNATEVIEVLLVRRTLAWVTGIILLISTLLGLGLCKPLLQLMVMDCPVETSLKQGFGAPAMIHTQISINGDYFCFGPSILRLEINGSDSCTYNIYIYYLLYMPITRDTLLYSNVKLD